MAAAIDEGGKLPDIELSTPSGGQLNLRDYLGKPFVLYFYHKDDTPGCTREAQDFSRVIGEFQERGAEVPGVSRETPRTSAPRAWNSPISRLKSWASRVQPEVSSLG